MTFPSTPRQPLVATDSNANIINLLNPESPEKLDPVSPQKLNPILPVKWNKGEQSSTVPPTLPGITIISSWRPVEEVRSEKSLSTSSSVLPNNKRKADELSDLDQDDPRLENIDLDCDQVRRKIRTFLASGEMKMAKFQKALEVNSNSYAQFMGCEGAYKGSRNDTYVKAYQFFKKRDLQGIKTQVKKVKKSEEAVKNDVSEIKLEGEETISVPVFDSCDEIRTKIRAYLCEPGISQAGFLREIAKTYPDGRRIQSKVLNDFLSKRGIGAGNTSAVFYSSYVFFEKLRLKDGKEKSKHRLDMERNYMDEGGFDVKHRMDGRSYC